MDGVTTVYTIGNAPRCGAFFCAFAVHASSDQELSNLNLHNLAVTEVMVAFVGLLNRRQMPWKLCSITPSTQTKRNSAEIFQAVQ